MFLMSELTLPFNYNYTNVLKLVSILAHSLFYFYFFWLTGTAIVSYFLEFFKRDDASKQFVKVLLHFPLKKISTLIVLGIIPLIVIYSIDLIWLKGNEFDSIHNLSLINLFLFILSILALYSYRSTFDLLVVFSKNVLDKDSKDLIELMESNLKKHKLSGLIGTIGLLSSLFLYSILNVAKLDYNQIDYMFDFFSYLLNVQVYLKFLYYLLISISLVYLVNLFLNFGWAETQLEGSIELNDFIRETSLKGAMISVLVQPAFILIELLLFPKNSLSYMIFLTSGIAVILVFIILNQLNAYSKESISNYLKYSFFMFIMVVISISSRDVIGISNVLKSKTVEIAQMYTTYEENLKNKLNIKTVSINGEEIFSAKCSACHRFDAKLVGPPYNTVLPKYENNREQLVKFILNPVKVNPEYPPMPAQGLIPPEAEAVADYILKVYKENSK